MSTKLAKSENRCKSSKRYHLWWSWWSWFLSWIILFDLKIISPVLYFLKQIKFPNPSKRIFFVIVIIMWSSKVTSYGMNVMSPRVVFTKQGPIQGFIGPNTNNPDTMMYHLPHLTGSNFNIRQYGGRPIIEVFKGIPYASSPHGALRFESPAPAPLRSRADVYNANVTKPPCPRTLEEVMNRTQSQDPFKALRKTMNLEDCLYLDIYAPLNSDKNRAAGLAVLVYMNSHMDDPEDPFDGSSMAAIGNIIVISVRYRTGVLGFLQPSFAENARSNFGLWDQLAALQWIKENIAEFGGDPNNVCLMGYDMDSSIAGLLALSPVSQAYNGLFHRLILLNGSPLAPNGINTQPLKTTYQLARALRCPLDDRGGDLASCLRKVPVPQLVTAAEKNIGAQLLTYPFSPIVDGTLVPHDNNLRNGPGHSQAVKEMLGKYDVLCGLKEGPVLPKIGRQLFNNIDMDRFVTAVIKLTMRMESGSEPTADAKREVVKAITNMYGTHPPMRELISDFLIVNPMIDLLNTHSESGKNTFFYIFKDYDPLKLNKHDEISYIFSNNVYNWKYTGTPSHIHDLHPFVLLITLMANFVRMGDPNVVDPSDRFPNPIKSWPKYKEDYGRYLEIAQGVQFPSGYRKLYTDFWGKKFTSIIKSFRNNSASDNFGDFPPFFPNRDYNNLGTNPEVYGPGGNSQSNNIHGMNPDTGIYYKGTTPESPIIAGGHNTVVLVGCLLLILNFLCFIGLFYQRERLKKAEIHLRKRYIETQKQSGTVEESQELESSTYAERGPTNNHAFHIQQHHHNPMPQISRDAMSETETENGFGPEFLSPNYDNPRTKVNRWMQMQAANRIMPIKGNSFEEYSNPTPTPSDMNPQHRLSRVREDENPYETTTGPSSLYHQPQPIMAPSPVILGLSHLPYQSPSSQQHVPLTIPMQIQINSSQRAGSLASTNISSMPQPPIAQPETPVQFFPQLPYQEPFRPSGHLGSDSIPYADSRATSPSIISAPAGFSNAREGKLSSRDNKNNFHGGPQHTSPPEQNRLYSMKHSPSLQSPSSPTASSTTLGESKTPDSPCSHKSSSILVTPTTENPKRTSTLIVRDLDPLDEELEKAEPKYAAVKTGTLKRSVAVDTDHESSVGNDISSSQNISSPQYPHSQIRVTFKENV